MRLLRHAHGVTLVETLVATGLIVCSLAILASLSSVALGTTLASRDRAIAGMLASSTYDTLSTARPLPGPSPPDTLARDTAGWHDLTDARGRVVGHDTDARGVVFVRRWHVAAWRGYARLRHVTVRVGRCLRRSSAGGCELGSSVTVSGLMAGVP